MNTRRLVGFAATLVIFTVASLLARTLWIHYMYDPWTRDGRVHADVITVAPDVSGIIVDVPVRDNQAVHKGDLLMQIDPSHYQIAVEQAQATVAARKADLAMRRDDAQRRADLDSEVVSQEQRDNADHAAQAAQAAYDEAVAALDAARLNLSRTRVVSPVDGYVTNLNTWTGDYATISTAKLAVIDAHSFWVYGYFEETKLPHVKVGNRAEIRLLGGGVLEGHVDSLSRGIFDRDDPQSKELTADVDPVFNWVRLAQRIPVRITIDHVPDGVQLAAGATCTVVVRGS